MGAEFVVIEPSDLVFPFELKKQVSSTIRLVNTTAEHVAYKVKTTSPKKYCVRPNTGTIPPKSSAEVVVLMQAQKEAPADLTCKDKFLIQSVKIPEGTNYREAAPELFSKEAGLEIQESKLKVVYVAPPSPPTPIAESAEEGLASPAVPLHETTKVHAREVPVAVANHAAPAVPLPAVTKAVAVKRGYSFLSVFLVAFFAFLIGYFYGQAPAAPN